MHKDSAEINQSWELLIYFNNEKIYRTNDKKKIVA
jgi:hypothetical protein